MCQFSLVGKYICQTILHLPFIMLILGFSRTVYAVEPGMSSHSAKKLQTTLNMSKMNLVARMTSFLIRTVTMLVFSP